MTIVQWNPIQQLAAMEIDRLSRMCDSVPTRAAARHRWMPPVDIYEDADHNVVIRAELPEMKLEDINVTVEHDTLTLAGERTAPAEVGDGKFHRRERAHGEFFRSFTLPTTLDASKVAASYRDGVLTISVPQREESKPRQIQVSAPA